MDIVWILIMLLVGAKGISMDHLVLYTEIDCLAAVDMINKVKPEKLWGENAELHVKCVPIKGVVN
jgi:hypothetical protein